MSKGKTMPKIKLPWRRFGGQRPETKKHVLLWLSDDGEIFCSCLQENRRWHTNNDQEDSRGIKPDTDDRWIYLSEIENPFEEKEE